MLSSPTPHLLQAATSPLVGEVIHTITAGQDASCASAPCIANMRSK